jgi:hypothetical protein
MCARADLKISNPLHLRFGSPSTHLKGSASALYRRRPSSRCGQHSVAKIRLIKKSHKKHASVAISVNRPCHARLLLFAEQCFNGGTMALRRAQD